MGHVEVVEINMNERPPLKGKGVLVGPKGIGKTEYIKKWGLNALVNAFEEIRKAFLESKSPKELKKRLEELLKRKDFIELSPWEYDYLMKKYGEVPCLREYLKRVYVLRWGEKDARKKLAEWGIERSPEKVKVRIEKAGYEGETWHPHLTKWRSEKRGEGKGVARLLGGISRLIGERLPNLLEILSHIGVPFLAPPLLETSVLISMSSALKGGRLPVAVEQIVKIASLHPHEREELERENGVEPGLLTKIYNTLVGDGCKEEVENLRKEMERIQANVKGLHDVMEKLEKDLEGKIFVELENLQKSVLEMYNMEKAVLEQVLPYTILRSAEEMREYMRSKLPGEEEIVDLESLGWYRSYIDDVLKAAEDGIVAITGPPGVGKTVLLYLIVKKLMSEGFPVAYLDESRIGKIGLGPFHVKEGMFLVFDDLTSSDTFASLVDSNYGRRIIYTARSSVQKLLEEEYQRREKREPGDRCRRKPISPDRETSIELLRRIMNARGVTLIPDDPERLYERLRIKSGGEEGVFLLYAGLLAKGHEGRVLEIKEIPPFADYLAEVLERILAKSEIFRGFQPEGGRELEFAANMLMLMMASLLEGDLTSREARRMEGQLALKFNLDRKNLSVYRDLLEEVRMGEEERLIMDHFTCYLLFTPNPLREEERRELMGARMPEYLFEGIRRAIEIMIEDFGMGERIMETYGIDAEAYLNEYCKSGEDVVPLTRLSAMLVGAAMGKFRYFMPRSGIDRWPPPLKLAYLWDGLPRNVRKIMESNSLEALVDALVNNLRTPGVPFALGDIALSLAEDHPDVFLKHVNALINNLRTPGVPFALEFIALSLAEKYPDVLDRIVNALVNNLRTPGVPFVLEDIALSLAEDHPDVFLKHVNALINNPSTLGVPFALGLIARGLAEEYPDVLDRIVNALVNNLRTPRVPFELGLIAFSLGEEYPDVLDRIVNALVNNLRIPGVPSALEDIARRLAEKYPDVLPKYIYALINNPSILGVPFAPEDIPSFLAEEHPDVLLKYIYALINNPSTLEVSFELGLIAFSLAEKYPDVFLKHVNALINNPSTPGVPFALGLIARGLAEKYPDVFLKHVNALVNNLRTPGVPFALGDIALSLAEKYPNVLDRIVNALVNNLRTPGVPSALRLIAFSLGEEYPDVLDRIVNALVNNLRIPGVPSALEDIARRLAEDHPDVLDRIVNALLEFGIKHGYVPLILRYRSSPPKIGEIKPEELSKLGLDVFALLLANDLIDMKKAREVVKGIKLKMIEAKESGDKHTFFGWYVMPEEIVLSI